MTDSKAPWLARGSAIALMMAVGIALAACGGGGGLNEDEGAGLKQELKDAQAQAATDAAARTAAEADAAAAETAKATAEAEKATAEAEKAAADAAREVAEADAAAAETAKAAADTAREAADTAREAAVAAKVAAEADAAAAETAKLAAEAETAAADTARKAAVAAKVAAEADAAAAETAKLAAEADTAAAEAEKLKAETEKAAADTARDAAVAQAVAAEKSAAAAAASAKEAADALVVAQAAQQVAEDAKAAAEDAQQDAEDAAAEADRLRRLAVAATTAEERRRQQAEEDRDRSDQEAEDARAIANRAQAKNAFDGLTGFVDNTPANIIGPVAETNDPEVTPRYRAAAGVSDTPGVTFVNPTTGTQGRWFRTSFSNTGGQSVDRMDVYSDAEQADRVDFKDSIYNPNNTVVNEQGDVDGSVPIMGDQVHTASSAFPRTSGVPVGKDLVDRGLSETEFDALSWDTDTDGVLDENEEGILEDEDVTRSRFLQYIRGSGFRDEDRYPERYTYSTSGTLQGASGTYRCSSEMSDTDCTVQNSGDHFVFVGPWTFRPSSGTTDVLIDDSEFMYFGWWSRQAIATEDWSFRVFHGPTGSRATDVSDVSGTATYQGPAVGQYAIYQPLGTESGHGAFSATATLTADFDSTPNTVHGTIDQFSGHSDWSLTLKHGEVGGGAAGNDGTDTADPGGVSWLIGGNAHEGGSWEADFYSNLATGQRTGVVPSGIAGTFEAEYTEVGRLIGAFGAHCRTGC